MFSTFERGDLLRVEWIDVEGNSGWHEPGDIEKRVKVYTEKENIIKTTAHFHSVVDVGQFQLAVVYSTEGVAGQVGDVNYIPVPLVSKVRRLRKASVKKNKK